MKSMTLTVAAAAMVIFVQSADAREHHHGHRHHHSLAASRGTFVGGQPTPSGLFAFAAMNIQSSATAYRGRDLARPAAWCGWEMRHLVGADPAPHHVGKIVGRQNGEWVIESGNDGHTLRVRPRSIAGAIAIRRG